MNRYRQSENRTAYTAARKGRTTENEEKEPSRHQRKERDDPSPEYSKNNKDKGRELNKNSSSPNLNE